MRSKMAAFLGAGAGGAYLFGRHRLRAPTGSRRPGAAVSAAHGSMNTYEGIFSALGAMNVFFDLVSIGLDGGAYFLLRKAPASTT